MDGMVAALLDERRGYVLRGRADRVAAVDCVLANFGIAVDDTIDDTGDVLETTDGAPVKGRRRK